MSESSSGNDEQIQLAGRVDVPMIGWECDNCGEPYNSRRPPQQDMCSACRRECIWELPKDVIGRYYQELWGAQEGDELIVCATGPAPLQGEIINIGGNHDVIWFGPQSDSRMVDVEDLRLHKDPDDYGHEIYYVEVI